MPNRATRKVRSPQAKQKEQKAIHDRCQKEVKFLKLKCILEQALVETGLDYFYVPNSFSTYQDKIFFELLARDKPLSYSINTQDPHTYLFDLFVSRLNQIDAESEAF